MIPRKKPDLKPRDLFEELKSANISLIKSKEHSSYLDTSEELSKVLS